MEQSIEESLYQAVVVEDQDVIVHLIAQGANPNKTASHGKTSLGEAANNGNTEIVKLLIEASNSANVQAKSMHNGPVRKRHLKCHKRKLYQGSDETVIKCRNTNDRALSSKSDKNQGYFVFIHSEGSSSDESRIPSLKSPLSPTSNTPSPQDELEWDEEIVNVATPTKEDETWSSMYKWYAAILECTGAAIASASLVTNGINQQDAFSRTALHYAVEQGHVSVVKLLIDAGCKLDIPAGDGLTPLHVCAIKNHLEIARMLLAAGSHVNYKTHEKMTPLHFAASRGYLELMNKKEIAYASMGRQTFSLSPAVKLLVTSGAYLEARDTNERTSLYLAASRGHDDVMRCLICSGANVNGEEIHGYTPLCEAVWQRHEAAAEVLLSAGARITHSHTLLHNAIIQRQDGIVRMLARAGGGVNLHNDNGDTPLLLAARFSQPNTARVLLDHGALVNSSNSITGANALHIAVESIEDAKEFEEMLLCLLEYRIDMNALALTGDTALNRALLLHRDDAAKLLIKHGADVNACDLQSCGLDNLTIASRRRSSYLADMLVKAGHYLHIPDVTYSNIPKDSTANWLYKISRQPLCLSDLCRIKIRSLSKDSILYRYVTNLPLPVRLKKFLMMELEEF